VAGNELTHTVTSTTPGLVMGTAAYMSPEQARGQVVDHRSDIFSFGCVFYEMLTGERAFPGDTPADITSAILNKDPELTGKMPPGYARIVQHCLEKSPDERLQSARDIVFAIDGVTQQDSGSQPAAPPARRNWLPWSIAALAILAAAVFAYRDLRPQPERKFQRLTFRRGKIQAARFTPDGNGVVYSATWEDEPSDLFTSRFESPGARALGFAGSELRGISSTGEIALAQRTRIGYAPFAPIGLLARAPFAGGAARAVDDNIAFADWSPSGNELTIIRETDQGSHLEFPAGKVIYTNEGYISEPRVSHDGTRVAFLDHSLTNDSRGSVVVVDRNGSKKVLSTEYASIQGLAWAPSDNEVWFTGSKSGAKGELHAVSMSGRDRLIYSAPVSLLLQDISRDGRVLLTNTQQRTKLMFRGASDDHERELSWLDWSLLNSMSRDGKLVVFGESGEGAVNGGIVFARETNGAPAVLLGPGGFPSLSPDGQSVVTPSLAGNSIIVYPIGPGPTKTIAVPGFTIGLAGLVPDGKRVWFNGNESSHAPRYYVMNVDGGSPKPITPEGTRGSPPGAVLNGKYLVGRSGGRSILYPIDGGSPVPLQGVSDQERIAGWSDDGQGVFVYSRNEFPARIRRVDLKTGKQQLIREIVPTDRAGINFGVDFVQITGDGKTYAYSLLQQLDELQLVEGLK